MHEHEVLGGRHVAAIEPFEHITRVGGRRSLRRVGEKHHAVRLPRTRFLPRAAVRSSDQHDEPARSFGAVDRISERRLGVVREGPRAQHGRLGVARKPGEHGVDERADVEAVTRREDRDRADPRFGATGAAVVHPVRDDPGDRERDARRALDDALERRTRQTGQLGVADRDDGRRARRAREQAELADGIAARELSDDDRLAGLVGEQRAQAAADDHVEAVRLLPLVEEGLATRDLDPLDVVEEVVELGVAEAGDQVHGRDRLACASRAVDDLHDRESFAVR